MILFSESNIFCSKEISRPQFQQPGEGIVGATGAVGAAIVEANIGDYSCCGCAIRGVSGGIYEAAQGAETLQDAFEKARKAFENKSKFKAAALRR